MENSIRVDSAFTRVLAAFGAAALAFALLPLAPASSQEAGHPSGSTQGDDATVASDDTPIDLNRLSGATRFQTAAEIATSAHATSAEVVIASGQEFPDALAGAALEGALDAPVLLVPADLIGGSIPGEITDAIDELGATNATFLGGSDAISDDVESFIVANSSVATTDRVAGSTRFETAAEIAEEVQTRNPAAGQLSDEVAGELDVPTGSTAAFLATGENFPDALAAGPGAYDGDHPVFLTPTNDLHDAAENGLSDFGADVVFILGGTAAVDASVESDLESQDYEVRRIGGANRFETATLLADMFVEDFGFDVADVGLATGDPFADALASAPFLGENNAPLVLTPFNTTEPNTEDFFDRHGCNIETIHVFGGEVAVQEDVAHEYAVVACTEPTEDAITGTVTDADTGDAIEGADVTATNSETFTATTDADGDYVLDVTTPETYTVTAEADGYADGVEEDVFVDEGEVVTVDFALDPEAAVQNYTGPMSWFQEIDDSGEPGAGEPGATGTFDLTVSENPSIEFEVSWDGVTPPFDGGPGMHIHEAPAGENGPIEVTLATGQELQDAAENGTGTISGTVEDVDDGSNYASMEELATAINDNPENFYVNLHSDAYPAGAIRGQLAGNVPEPPDTNETFEVTPDDADTNPVVDGSRDYTATGFSDDTGEVVLELADAGNVTRTDGIVTFATNEDNGDFTANFGTVAADITNVTVGGTTFPAVGAGDTVSVDADSTIEFTVESDGATEESVTPVVYDGDDADDLPTDADGDPLNDFGVGGDKTFVNVVALELDPQESLNPFGTEHSVTATLVDGDGDTVVLDGQEVDFEVGRFEDPNTPNAPLQPDNHTFGTIPSGNLEIEETVAFDANGEATLTYTGPANPEDQPEGENRIADLINAQWDGQGDFENEQATADNDVGNDAADTGAEKVWTDEEAKPATFDVEPADSLNLEGTDHTVTATIENQFGDPVEDAIDVDFTVNRGGTDVATGTRTTDSGVATFTYNGPNADAEDTITVVADEDDLNAAGADDGADAMWTVDVFKDWAAEADADAEDAEVFGANIDTDWIFVEPVPGDAYDYNTGDRYFFNGDEVDQAEWEDEVADRLDDDDLADEAMFLNTYGYTDSGATTIFSLYEDDADAAAEGEPGAVDSVVASADPENLPGGGGETSSITATVEDAFGQPVQGETVTFTHDGSGSLSDGGTDDTDANGEAEVTYTTDAADDGSTVTVDATADGVTDSATIDVGATVDIDETTLDDINSTNETSHAVEGTGAANDDVTVVWQDTAGDTVEVTTSVDGVGDWIITDADVSGLDDGDVDITATQASDGSTDTETVTKDTVAPDVFADTADNGDLVFEVAFDEEVDATSANDTANYDITNGNGATSVTGAALQPDGVTVELTVDVALDNTNNDVTLDQTVDDLFGNTGTQTGYVLVAQ